MLLEHVIKQQGIIMKNILNQFFKQSGKKEFVRGNSVLRILEEETFADYGEKLILDELRSVYIVIPKTGCTSAKKFFSNYYGWKEAFNVHDPLSEIYEHVVRDDLLQEKYGQYYIFTFVRNPFSRLYSAYKSKLRLGDGAVRDRSNKTPSGQTPNWIDGVPPRLYKMGIRKEHNFRQFTEIVCATPDSRSDPHVKSQYQFVVSNNGKLLIDKFYRFENYQEDFMSLLGRLGINASPDQLPHENKTQSKLDEYVQYYDQDMVDMVVKRYKEDFNLFGYSTKL